jgi:iduronate 2-sulfatase
MNRRAFLSSLAAPALFAQARRRMNVLLLMADDMNNAIGCYGRPLVKTPNIDRLANRGIRFDRAYCQFPLCGPSRASLLTGLRPDTTGVTDNFKPSVDFRHQLPDAVTLPQLFKNSGYFTARTGKIFHMDVPKGVGTNEYQDPLSWNYSSSPPGLENNSKGKEIRLHSQTEVGRSPRIIQTATPEGQADYNVAGEAVALIEKHRNEPFFLGVGQIRPHGPWVAPSRFFDLYPLDNIELARNPPNDLDDIPKAHQEVRPQDWHNMGLREADQKQFLQAYYACTSFMDDQAGRVLDALDRLGLSERTVVVFIGDHGWNLGEHTRWSKMCLFEESARAPMIVAAPGVKGNGRPSRALVEFVDIYPTVAELCGLTPPPNLQGQSFVPLLNNPARAWKKAAFTQLQHETRIFGHSVRTDRYHYIVWQGEGGGEELYDHQEDPREFRNLASLAPYGPTLKMMRKILADGWKAARAVV